MSKLKLLREIMQSTIDNIDAGNTTLSEEQAEELFDSIAWMTNPESKLSKYQAAKELGKSRATIDNYVREGKLKLREQQGFKEKFIYRRDINKLKLQLNEHNQ